MDVLPPESLVRQLRWRYATKRFDPARKIPADQWEALEQALVLTPSSFGLQPWRFVVVTDAHLKSQLSAASYRQSQPAECSHLLVLARRSPLLEEDIDRFIARTAEVRGEDPSTFAKYRQVMSDFRAGAEKAGWLQEWAERQVYIALGSFMTAAAMLGVDTCPMEGIQPQKYDELLGLESSGYATSVACAAGYRAADDKYAALPKIRYRPEDVITRR